jgi:CelD/BcsL family acetyltransferase involved in cellulose biosynthesis
MFESAAVAEMAEPSLQWTVLPLLNATDELSEWDKFNDGTWNTPLLSASFLRPALQHFGDGRERLAIARRGDRPVAMMILVPTTRFSWSTFQPSQLPLATVLLARGERLEAVMLSLFRALPPYVLALSIQHLDSRFIPRSAEASRADFLPHMSTGVIEFAADSAEYFSSRPSSLRKNVERRERRATTNFGEPRLDVFTMPHNVEQFMALYASTESGGWKGQAGTAVRVDGRQGHFYRDTLVLAANAGQARMFVLRFGDVPVAQQIAIEHAGVLYLMKTTYDEQYRQYAPGVLQRWHVLCWAAAHDIDRVELYGRLKEWQRPFITGSREIYHATYYRLRAVRQLRDVMHRMRRPDVASIPDGAREAGIGQNDDDAVVSTPFATAAWFDLLEDTCFGSAPGRGIRITGRSNPGAFVPLWFHPGCSRGSLSAVSNFYTPLFAPTGTQAQQEAAVFELVRFLRETRGWSTLRLQPIADDAPWLEALTRELQRVGMIFDRYHCFGNWYADVSNIDSATFEKALTSRVRHTLVRAERRMQLAGGFEIMVESGTLDSNVLEQCVDDFCSVYQRSWKRAEPYPRFIPELFALASRKGWLRYGCLRHKGEPIASQLWLTHAGVASIYKLAYDSRFARYSPGSLLTRALIRHALDVDRVREIDYLAGDDNYKRDWMMNRRSRIGLIVFNRASPSGVANAARHYAGKRIKRLKRFRSNEILSKSE